MMSNAFKAAFQRWSTAGGPARSGRGESALLFTRALRRVGVSPAEPRQHAPGRRKTRSGGVDVPQVMRVRAVADPSWAIGQAHSEDQSP
jgi:hypothetical protein